MDILRSVVISLLIIVGSTSYAQDNVTLMNAFAKSYELENSGNYEEAITTLKAVYQEESYEINLRLGWLHYLSGLFSESMPYYQKCVYLHPMSIEARLGIVLPASSMGNWTQVEKQYNDILTIDPENSQANFRLGMIYYGREDYTKALSVFEKLLNRYPFDYDIIMMTGWTQLRKGETRKAKILFNKALLNRPNDSSALEGLKLIK
ncbi:MAG: tetratricopeptide repeat protein [Bacteroidetes bacterium]|nr:tetratricopeptide repeat protein [Bacteroidota bacterium]